MSPYVLALLAALAFALGSVLQQRGTLETPHEQGDPRFLLEILRKPVWLLGDLFQILAWVLQAAALERGSLVVVQSLYSLGLVFALPLGARLTGQYVGRRTIIGACTTLVGILAFLTLGRPQGGASEPGGRAWLVAGLIGLGVMLLLVRLAHRRRDAVAAALFATAAGISLGFQAAITKVFVGEAAHGLGAILSSWTTYALLVPALTGFILLQSALKTGFLAPALAASHAATLATSVLLGVALFQESISHGRDHLPPALLALALAIFGVVLLASPGRRPAEGTPA
jgi:drug/metabolite transporter (DMT)-like permease